MPSKKSSRRKIAVCVIALLLMFSSLFTVAAFAYYQNPTASVLFHWSKVISNSYPRITVYGRNSSGEESNNTIYSMNGLNGHALSIDNVYRPVYCLNPNQEADSNYVEGPTYKAARWARLTVDQQDLVLRALYCGYPNTADSAVPDQSGTYPMSSEHAQRLALQAMIFNIRCNFVVKSGTGVAKSTAYNNTDSFDERVSSDYANFHTAYANLYDRMNGFTPTVGIPSFSTLSTETAAANKTIKLEYDASSGNYTASVTDTNGVLSYFNFASLNGGGITYAVNGNVLSITATPEAAANLSSATRKGNVTSSAPDVKLTVDDVTFYVKSGSGTDNYQTMVEYVSSTTSLSYKKVYLMLQADASGTIKVVKSSSDTSVTDDNNSYFLEGAVFSIYATRADAGAKRSPVGTITTDARGEGTSAALAPATYYVRETTAPPGYELSDEIQTAVVPGGATVTLNAEDMPVTKDFTLKKRSSYSGYSSGNSAYSLEGAQYGVYASEANAKADAHRLEMLTTDGSGNATSGKRYALGKKLYIKELTASPGYLLDTQVYSLTISASGSNAITVREVPTADSGHMRIRKVDGEGTELKTITESSAVFKVEFFPNADGSGTAAKTWYFKTTDGVLWLNDPACLDAAQTNAEFYLDANGNVVFPIGTVKITEVAAPAGYVPTDTVLLAHISQDSSGAAAVWHWATDSGGVISYEAEGATFENKLIRGNLEVIKKDKYENNYLSDAGFRVYDSKGNQVAEGYTDANGKLTFSSLPYGEYTCKEFKAPKGYILDETEYPFSIAENGATVTHTRDNERRPGTIEVKKQDAAGKPFAGVTFLLEYSTDNGSSWAPVFTRAADSKDISRGGCTSPGLSKGQLVTDDSGMVRFTGLRADGLILYRLTETAAPEGCSLITEALYVGSLPVESNNTSASDAEQPGNKTFVYSLYITATNDPVFRLPETGGSGFGYLPLSLLLAASFPMLTQVKKRKGDHSA